MQPDQDLTKIPQDTWTAPLPPDDGSPLEPEPSKEEGDADILDTGLV